MRSRLGGGLIGLGGNLLGFLRPARLRTSDGGAREQQPANGGNGPVRHEIPPHDPLLMALPVAPFDGLGPIHNES